MPMPNIISINSGTIAQDSCASPPGNRNANIENSTAHSGNKRVRV